MIEAHPIALAVAGYLGVGTLGLLIFSRLFARRGKPVITRSDGLLFNTIFVAVLVVLMPPILMAVPFLWLHVRRFAPGYAMATGRLHRHPGGRRPAVGCLHCLPPSTTPTANATPAQIPAFLRRQADPEPDPHRR